ncbi:MAG: copper amine oxidase N-terminal domain-containing protein [Defluviitaleaceae bacterium]|nr:copper amine oxidase N-terminal domain-containing protein [Defluviitaleaceae bacterium]
MLDKIKGLRDKLPKMPNLPKIKIPEKFARFTKYIKYGGLGLICVAVIGIGALIALRVIRGTYEEVYEETEVISIADRFSGAALLDLAMLYDDYFVEEYVPAPEPEPLPPPPPPLVIAINDVSVMFNSTPAFINEQVYVPLRGVFEALGYRVNWDSLSETAMVSDGINTFIFSEEDINIIGDGAVMLPLAPALERMGYSFYFDEEANVFIIYTYNEDNGNT